jgi:hypothetical protein
MQEPRKKAVSLLIQFAASNLCDLLFFFFAIAVVKGRYYERGKRIASLENKARFQELSKSKEFCLSALTKRDFDLIFILLILKVHLFYKAERFCHNFI